MSTSTQSVRPRGRRNNIRWTLLPILFLGFTVAWMDRTNLSVAAPFMSDDLELGP